jgi:hypothetical protein
VIKAAPSFALKDQQLEALAAILPPTAEVADMLRAWRGADARYWGGCLTPCWLTANIEPYGACIGSWNTITRTLNLVPMLWRSGDLGSEGLASVTGVVIHEACHQAQHQLYCHLDAAKGPRGRWTDHSHRCPSWSRAVEDVIQAEDMDVFCPVWHRSSGNQWHPWVPASDDWMTWERADPEAHFNGRRLLSFKGARSFMGPGFTLSGLIETLGLPSETKTGKAIQWDL